MRPFRVLMALLLCLLPLCAAEARNGFLPHFGFGVDNFTTPAGEPVLRITNVEPGSLAAQAGLTPDMLLFFINGVHVPLASQLGDRFHEVWNGDDASMTLKVFDQSTRKVRTLSIALAPAAKPELPSVVEGANGETLVIQMPKAKATLASHSAHTVSIVSRQAATALVLNQPLGPELSPPFVELPFRCVVENGVARDDRSQGPFYHQVIRGNPHDGLNIDGDLEYTYLGVDGVTQYQGSRSPHVFSYEIACHGGRGSAADISRLMGAAIAARPQLQRSTSQGIQDVFYYVDGAITLGGNFLAAGLGVGPPLQMFPLKDWDNIHHRLTFTVMGAVPATPPATPVPMATTRFFAIHAPWLQYLIAALLAVFLIPVFASYKPLPAKSSIAVMALLTGVLALGGTLAMSTQPTDPAALQAVINAQMTAARAAEARIEADHATLAALTPSLDAINEPISKAAFDAAVPLRTTHVIPAVAAPLNPDLWVWLMLPPLGLFALFVPRAYLGAAYFLTSHPAAKIAKPKLQSGARIYPDREFVKSFDRKIEDIIKPPPEYVLRARAARGKVLQDDIKQDEAIISAAIKRDMAQADRDIAREEMLAAKERLRRARAKLPWWRRWF